MSEGVTLNIKKFLKTLGATYLIAAKHALATSRKNWIIFPASALLLVIFQLLAGLFMGNSAGGFLMGLVEVAFISFYFNWLRSAERKEKLQVHDLWQFDYAMFSPVINAAFVLYIVRYLASTLLGTHMLFLLLGLELLIFIVMNALPEIIYCEIPFQMESFGRSFNFIKDNWPEWFLPYVIIFLPLILTNPQGVLIGASQADPLLPVKYFGSLFIYQSSSLFGAAWPTSVLLIIGVLAGNWLMFFRGSLYQELANGSRRQRMFRA